MATPQTQTPLSDTKTQARLDAEQQVNAINDVAGGTLSSKAQDALTLHHENLNNIKENAKKTWKAIESKYRQIGLDVPEHVTRIAQSLGMGFGGQGILEFIYQIQNRFGLAYFEEDPRCSLKPQELNELINAIRYPENYPLRHLPIRHMRKSFLGFIFDAVKVTVILQSFMKILAKTDVKNLSEKTDIGNIADMSVWFSVIKDYTNKFPLRALTVALYRLYINRTAASQFDQTFVNNMQQLISGTAVIWDSYEDLLLTNNFNNNTNLTNAFNVMSGIVNEIEQKGLGEFAKDKFFKFVKSTTDFFTGNNEEDAQEAYEDCMSWLLTYGYNEIADTHNNIMIDDAFNKFVRYVKTGWGRITNSLNQTGSTKDLAALEKVRDYMRVTQSELANWIGEYVANYKKLVVAVKAADGSSLGILGRILERDAVQEYLKKPNATSVRTISDLSYRLTTYRVKLNDLYKISGDFNFNQRNQYNEYCDTVNKLIDLLIDYNNKNNNQIVKQNLDSLRGWRPQKL